MTTHGLYLTNSKQWGVHEPNSLLAYLSSVHSCLTDHTINKAKKLAEKMDLKTFNIIYVNVFGAADTLYVRR